MGAPFRQLHSDHREQAGQHPVDQRLDRYLDTVEPVGSSPTRMTDPSRIHLIGLFTLIHAGDKDRPEGPR